MPSAALRPKNPCQASLIEGWSVGVPDRPHPPTPASGCGTLLTLPASGGGPLLTPPPLAGKGGREQTDGTPALQPRVNLSHALFQARSWKVVQTPFRRSGQS